ncbi:MAG: cation-translocating P-type ATPase [Lysobacterales bacterium]
MRQPATPPGTAPGPGLSPEAAAERLAEHGPNALPVAAAISAWWRLLRQFHSPLIYLLLFAFAFDLGLWLVEGRVGAPVEALAILSILLVNAGLGAFQEFRSEQALNRLKAIAAPQAWVMRGGWLLRVASDRVVQGDLLRVASGERVPADGRLLAAEGLLVDESVLTGESAPVDKSDRDSLYSGTLLVRGRGWIEVTATGAASNMGKLAGMLHAIALDKTPLQKRIDRFGLQIAQWVGALAVLLVVAGVLAEGISRFQEMLLFAVALAVAAVPEGMPAVVTLTLALGVQRMAGRKAVVRRLSAVEALGSVTVIATDKTGTLTENRMRVHALDCEDRELAVQAMVLVNDADLDAGAGDPLELGLLEYARDQGVDIAALRARHPRVALRAFDSANKFMRVSVASDGAQRSLLKGAPEVLIERCALTAEQRSMWLQRATAAADAGHRVLALASGTDAPECDLRMLGLVLLWDPPRAEVADAMHRVRAAGVRVVMVTGDHPGTAAAVAKAIGMGADEVLTGPEIEAMDAAELRQRAASVGVFARVSPQHKLRLVEALKANGDVVAMTGDGVNDAPALKRADVGIAMGIRGSDVSREVADLVLLDDNFASIVAAIEEGRSIYANILKFIRFQISTDVALVMLVVAGAALSYLQDLRDPSGMLLLPLTALQLLWINVVADSPPALALAMDRNPGVMQEPPRPSDSRLLDPTSLRFVWVTGAIKAGAGLALLVGLPVLGYTAVVARSALFLFEACAQIVFAYPARRIAATLTPNPLLHWVVLASLLLQLATIVLPGLRTVLGLWPLDPSAVAIVLFTVLGIWLVAEWMNRRLQRATV